MSWTWLPLAGKSVIRVTAFGDFFLADENGIWFLDKLDGCLTHVCGSESELDFLLQKEDAQDLYLFGGFVEKSYREGMLLNEGQCYDFTISPLLGGVLEYKNVCVRNFVVAVSLAGQLLQNIRRLPNDAKITGFTVAN